MSGKYMKVKRLILPTITVILITSQLFGCASVSKDETLGMLQNSDTIEIELAEPTDSEDSDATQLESLQWIQLGLLETHPDLRKSFDTLLKVTTDSEGNKIGRMYLKIVYTYKEDGSVKMSAYKQDNNSYFFNALGNETFVLHKGALADEISSLAYSEYTDIEEDSAEALNAVLNAYFELLPDTETGVFNGSSSLTRAQAMTLVTRAIQSVPESGIPAPNTVFANAVGNNIYTDYAAQVNEHAYLNTENGLSENTFNSAMSQGEYITLLMNAIFKDTASLPKNSENVYDSSIKDLEATPLTTIKDAGSITLAEAIQDAENGCPSDMYDSLSKAVTLGIISEDNLEWDSAITKSDAIELFMSASEAYYDITGYATAGSEATAKKATEVTPEILEMREYQYSNDWEARYEVLSKVDPSTITEPGDAIEYWKNYGCMTAAGYRIEDYDSANDLYYAFMEAYGANSTSEACSAYAISQGADGSLNNIWLYKHGKSAGSGHSYAVDQLTGAIYVAGPNTIFPGDNSSWNGEGDEYEWNLYLEMKGKDNEKDPNNIVGEWVANPFPGETYNWDTQTWE